MKIYVDDLNQVGYCLPLGSRYENGKLYIPGKGWQGRARKGQAITAERMRQIETEAECESNHTIDQRRRGDKIYKVTNLLGLEKWGPLQH